MIPCIQCGKDAETSMFSKVITLARGFVCSDECPTAFRWEMLMVNTMTDEQFEKWVGIPNYDVD